jgi:hypothetical protein
MQNRGLSRADEVFSPERTEDYKRRAKERAEKRGEMARVIMANLLNNADFREWLSEMAISFGFWRVPNRELSPYEQGRRAAIHELVERVLASGGEDAQKWFAEKATNFAQWIQQERSQ